LDGRPRVIVLVSIHTERSVPLVLLKAHGDSLPVSRETVDFQAGDPPPPQRPVGQWPTTIVEHLVAQRRQCAHFAVSHGVSINVSDRFVDPPPGEDAEPFPAPLAERL
jgi:hypothetical protein